MNRINNQNSIPSIVNPKIPKSGVLDVLTPPFAPYKQTMNRINNQNSIPSIVNPKIPKSGMLGFVAKFLSPQSSKI